MAIHKRKIFGGIFAMVMMLPLVSMDENKKTWKYFKHSMTEGLFWGAVCYGAYKGGIQLARRASLWELEEAGGQGAYCLLPTILRLGSVGMWAGSVGAGALGFTYFDSAISDLKNNIDK